jgi:hypothetical protein
VWTLLLAWGVKKLRIGITFVSSSYFKPKRRRFHFELPLLFFLAVLFVLPPPSSIDRLDYSPFMLVGISVSLVMLLAASYRREQED